MLNLFENSAVKICLTYYSFFCLTEMKNSKWFLYMWIFDTYLDRILYGVLNMKNLVLLLVFISWTEAQFSQNNYQGAGFLVQNPCVSKQTCSECLQTPTCAWCMKEVSRKNCSWKTKKSHYLIVFVYTDARAFSLRFSIRVLDICAHNLNWIFSLQTFHVGK